MTDTIPPPDPTTRTDLRRWRDDRSGHYHERFDGCAMDAVCEPLDPTRERTHG